MDLGYIACFILCYDVWFYISHIMMHRYFYKFHGKHYLEIPFQSMGFIIPFIHFKSSLIYQPINIITAFIFVNVRGFMTHDNRFSWLIGNHHILHHTHPRYNYCEYWLDDLFDTAYPKI